MTDHIYLEALQNYLTGEEWRENIQTFVMANCKYFNNLKDLSHQHHIIWKRFQEVVESVLEMALGNIGGSIDSLETALDEVMHTPSKGPRDDVKKDILRDLNTCADFQEFCDMMHRAYRTAVSGERHHRGGDGEDNNYDVLFKMGFSINAIETVAQSMPNPDAVESLEELVVQLTMLESDPSSQHHDGSKQVSSGGSDGKRQSKSVVSSRYDADSKGEVSILDIIPTATISAHPHLDKFADEANMTSEDASDLNAKFTMAESVIESFSLDNFGSHGGAASVTADSGQQGVEQLLRWASAMRDLHEDIRLAFEENMPCVDVKLHHPDGLIAWFQTLELSRQAVDEDSIAGHMLSDAELHRMAVLDEIAESGDRSTGEKALHSLLAAHSQTKAEIDALHRQFGLLVVASNSRASRSEGSALRRENLEELYLFLKEQVHSGAELSDIVDEMHETVYSLVSGQKGAEVVSKLLDLHVLEEEEIMLRAQIQAIVGSDIAIPSSGGGVLGDTPVSSADAKSPQRGGSGDCDGNNIYSGTDGYPMFGSASDSKTADFSAGDFKSGGGGAGADQLSSSAAAVMYNSDAKISAAGTVAGAADHSPLKGYDDSDAAAKRAQINPSAAFVTLLSKETPAEQQQQRDGLAAGAVGATTNEIDAASDSKASPMKKGRDEDEFITNLRREQKAALKALQESLLAEKHRKLSAIEDKLRRRKMQLQQQAAKGKSLTDANELTESNELTAVLEKEINAIEAELDTAKEDVETWSAGCVSGFKKRCIAETKKIKQIAVAAADEKGDSTGTKKPVYCKLTKMELAEVQNDVAKAIRERFERDQASLLESLEAERAKQKRRIETALSKRRQQVSASGDNKSGIMMMEWKAKADMEMMHNRLDEEESRMLARAQANTLASLSALYMDRELLEPAVESSSIDDGDALDGADGDDELISPSKGGSKSQRRLAWLRRADEVRDGYTTAGKQLQHTLRSAQRKARVDSDQSDGDASRKGPLSADEVLEELEEEQEDAFSSVTTHMMKVINEAFVNNLLEEGAEASYADPAKRFSKRNDAERVKAGILDEFERAKADYDESVDAAQARSRANLEKRRQRKDYKFDSSGGAAEISPQDLLENVMDSFLSSELAADSKAGSTTVVNKADEKRYVGITPAHVSDSKGVDSPQRSPMADQAVVARVAVANSNSDAASKIRDAHLENEKRLEETLKAEMLAKKKILENRLKSRRSNREGGSSTATDDDIEEIALDNAEDLALKNDTKRLEDAYNTIIGMLHNKEAFKSSQAPDAAQLLALMDKLAEGQGHAEDSTEKAEGGGVKDTSSYPSRTAGYSMKTGVGGDMHNSQHAWTSHKKEEKGLMEEEVRRISLMYNEENQKHDLMMKIQQARQKQALQKKLHQRQQAKFNQQQSVSAGDNDNEDVNSFSYNGGGGGLRRGAGDEIVIGNAPSPKKYGPSNAQPVFKGLDASANISMGALNKNISSRGMNLNNIMKRK